MENPEREMSNTSWTCETCWDCDAPRKPPPVATSISLAPVCTLHGGKALKGHVSCGGGRRSTFVGDGCITCGQPSYEASTSPRVGGIRWRVLGRVVFKGERGWWNGRVVTGGHRVRHLISTFIYERWARWVRWSGVNMCRARWPWECLV